MTALSGSLQLRGRTAAAWVTNNDVLLARQPGVETDTGQMKIGDGVTAWNDLDYVGTGGGGVWGSITGTLSDQTDLADALDAKADRESELLTGGVITVGTYGGAGSDNDIRVTASTYFILGQGGYVGAQTDFLDIALSAAGNQRYIGIYGKTDSTITKVEGAEAPLAVYPSTPANHCLFGYVLVTDTAASTTPDLSGYLLKSSKATPSSVGTGTDDETYITPYALFNAKQNCQVFFQWATISPSDSTQYYISPSPLALATSNNGRGVAPITGIIYAVTITTRNNVVNSAEASSLHVSVNGGADQLITSAYVFVNPMSTMIVTGLSIAVTAGDTLALSITTPAWVTNPTNTAGSVVLFIK